MRLCTTIWLILMLLIARENAYGQWENVSLTDSLVAGEQSPFVTNLLKMTGTQPGQELMAVISMPQGWQLIGDTVRLITLTRDVEESVPLSIKRLPHAGSNWSKVVIRLVDRNHTRDTCVFFHLRAQPVYKALIRVSEDAVFLAGNTREANIRFTIRNTGNAGDTYRVELKCDKLQIVKTQQVEVASGQQYSGAISLTIPKLQYALFRKEDFFLHVVSQNGFYSSSRVVVSKIASSAKELPSAYDLTEVQTESGLLVNGTQASYYGSVSGSLKWKASTLVYNYRTKQYGSNNRLYSNVYNLKYTTGRWKISLGQMNDSRVFYGIGRGLSAEWSRKSATFFVSGIKGDRAMGQAGDMLLASVQMAFKKVSLTQIVAANQWNEQRSLALQNELSYAHSEKFSARISLGSGGDFAIGSNRYPLGYALGYSAQLRLKGLSASSKFQKNDQAFPGINRGLQSIHHMIHFGQRVRGGLFYSYNRTLANPFRDTIYNSDVLTYNTRRYGVDFSLANKSGFHQIAAGKMSSTIASSGLADYDFAEVTSNLTIAKSLNVSISSTIGRSSEVRYSGKPTYFTSSSARVSLKSAGISAVYTAIPSIQDSQKITAFYRRTLSITPYFQYRVGSGFNIHVSYNLSRTLQDDRVISMITTGVNYLRPKSGFDLSLYGALPMQTSKVQALGYSSTYVSLTVRKKLSVPLVFKKRYQKLAFRFFEDENLDRRLDPGERTIDSLQVKLNGYYFISSKGGRVAYTNVRKGAYTLDLSSMPKGLVPVFGTIQVYEVKRNQSIEIPFVKGKVISGRVHVENDSLSTLRFSPEGVKVIASDTLGNTYSALCDPGGNYYMNVPSGYYKVSLNPEAFSDIYKPDYFFQYIKVTDMDEQVLFHVRQQKRKVRILNN